jgi:hypothetical protein
MQDDLTEATKKTMGFVDQAPTCEECVYIKEEDDKYVDRSWYQVCTFSNLCNFTTEKWSVCNRFKKK